MGTGGAIVADRNGSKAKQRNLAQWREFADNADRRPEARSRAGKPGVWIPENLIIDALELNSEDQCRDVLGALVIEGYTDGYDPHIKSSAARKRFDSSRRALANWRDNHNQGVENGKKGGNPSLVRTQTGPNPDPNRTESGPNPDRIRTERNAATSAFNNGGVNPISKRKVIDIENPYPLPTRYVGEFQETGEGVTHGGPVVVGF